MEFDSDVDQVCYIVEGLEGPAEILVDHWGVPHMYASSFYDVFFVQGFNAARDRLWQLDLWRRRGLGLLSEVFGGDYVERDRAARLFLYRGDMWREWSAYGSDTERVVTAFTAGINAYVSLTREDSALLPVEFRQLGYQPAWWAAEDVARIRSHGLFYNLTEEVARARVLHRFGPGVEDLRRHREPPHELRVPDGLDLSLIPDDVLRLYELVTTAPTFPGSRGAAQVGGGVRPPEGSNNWVVAPERSATGRALLANDPHRALSLPSLRYIAHLCAPGLDVIGAGEPALPGICIGHNGHIAFGLTIFPIDQEDLYVYETNPDDPREYWHQGRWERMRVETEAVPVAGAEPVTAELCYTRHGPVIYCDPERCTAFAVRAAWLEPGMAPYLGGIGYMRARDWDQFRAAMNRWGAPPENQVYADTVGNIGWKTAGLTPIRRGWDGTLPVPGDGRYEWAGFRDMDELPGAVNPVCGWLATANEMNLPGDFPTQRRTISYDWQAPHRHQRIAEVLADRPSLSVRDCLRLQTDYLSIPARRIVRRLGELRCHDQKTAQALALLRGWDGSLAADSAAAALFEVWYRQHLRPALLTQALGQVLPPSGIPDALTAILPEENLLADARVDLQLLEEPGDRLGPHPHRVLTDILISSLGDAVDHVESLLGPDWGSWAWGRLHVARLTHPLAGLLDQPTRSQMRAGPAPRGGSGDTVGNTAYLPDFTQGGGSTFRVVVDVGNWDGSLVMNAPGQSGDLNSPHYADLFDAWTRDEAFPLLYTRQRVQAAAERRITLEPSKRSAAMGEKEPGPATDSSGFRGC